eukprot:jgi/Botrbrau1/21559/Bobra.174_2s0058.2
MGLGRGLTVLVRRLAASGAGVSYTLVKDFSSPPCLYQACQLHCHTGFRHGHAESKRDVPSGGGSHLLTERRGWGHTAHRSFRTSSVNEESKDYYEILGVSKNSSDAEIKRAFYQLAKKYHPDTNKDDPTAEAKFQNITKAYDTLRDPQKRQVYDMVGPEGMERGMGQEGGAKGATGFGDIDIDDILKSFFGAARRLVVGLLARAAISPSRASLSTPACPPSISLSRCHLRRPHWVPSARWSSGPVGTHGVPRSQYTDSRRGAQWDHPDGRSGGPAPARYNRAQRPPREHYGGGTRGAVARFPAHR